MPRLQDSVTRWLVLCLQVMRWQGMRMPNHSVKSQPVPSGLALFSHRLLPALCSCASLRSRASLTGFWCCRLQEAEIFAGKLADVNACEQAFNRLWTQCQRCQGDLHKDVLCTSRDCPIYYRRKKIQKDLSDAHDVVQRFGAPAW